MQVAEGWTNEAKLQAARVPNRHAIDRGYDAVIPLSKDIRMC